MERKVEGELVLLPGAQINGHLEITPTSSYELRLFPRLGLSPSLPKKRIDAEMQETFLPQEIEQEKPSTHQANAANPASNPDTFPLIRSDDIEIQQEVGNGTFATVHRAVLKGKIVAAKISIDSINKRSFVDLEDFKREGQLLSQVRNEFVLQCYGYFVTPGIHAGILIEYIDHASIEGGTLNKLLAKRAEALSWEQQWRISWEVSSGINALHQAGIVHGDVKSSNVLVYLAADQLWHTKISDLGLAHTTREKRHAGTPLWWAPEMLASEDESSSISTDIYSLGLLLWSIHSREVPFANYNNAALFASHLVYGKKEDNGAHTFPVRPPIASALQKEQPKYAILMQLCWEQKPENRPKNVLGIIHVLESIKPPQPK